MAPTPASLLGFVDFSQPSLWSKSSSDFASHTPSRPLTLSVSVVSAASIVFNPTFWNIAARSEYHNKTITKLAGGNPRYGCYALAVTIFSIGIIRDALYERALRAQPTHPLLEGFVSQALAVGLVASGNVLVLSSMWALGITGTYLGDYFGILMDEIVTGFPFNVSGSPMYYGSTMSFIGTALWFGKPAGLVLSALVYVVYEIALRFEDPFTSQIYAKRDQEQKKKSK